MPPPARKGQVAKDSKTSKQTTLFASPISSSPYRRNSAISPKTYSRPAKKTKRTRSRFSSSSDDIGAIRFAQPETINIVTSSDEDGPSASKGKRKRNLARLASESPTEEAKSSPQLSSPSAQVDSDSEDVAPRKRRRLRRLRSWEDDVGRNEVADELANEVDEESVLDSRFRTRDKKTKYQTDLERLKRRKLKMNSHEDDENELADEDEEDIPKPFKGAKPSSQHGGSDDEASDSTHSSDFIVEDNNVVQLPAQFSMETHQDLSHQFKKIFQFFVHIAVQPSETRSSFMKSKLADEEYFSVPLQMMRRKLLGIRDSLVSSSVWKPGFKKTLERYPELSLIKLDFAFPYCDACHLGGRMSTIIGRLMGFRYNALGFDPLISDVEGDSDAEGKEYHLGRFCARRSRVYHEFSHWEHALFQSIERELDELRCSSSGSGFHRVAYCRGIDPPDDLSDADALCEWLDQRKIIDAEWQKLKSMMDNAHRLELHGKGDEED